MEYKPYIGFKGIYPDLPTDLCPDTALLKGSQNIRIRNGILCAKYGYEKLQSEVLRGVPLLFHEYQNLAGESTFLCLTKKDVLYWDNTYTKWKYLTPTYATGTVSCSGGTSVTGTGTSWVTNGIEQGDEIGFETTNPDNVTTWYEIASVNSETSLTLTANGPVVSGVSYVIRKVYHADYNNRWSAVNFYDGSIGANICVMTNGSDYPIYWNGNIANKCADLSGGPPKAKYVASFKGRLFFANILDVQSGKVGTELPYTIIWSPVSDAEIWTSAGGAGYQELYDTEGDIKWVITFGEYLAIGKSDCIVLMRSTGMTDIPFEPYYVIKNKGSLASCVNAIPGALLFITNDDIVLFDGTPALKSIAENKIKETFFEEVSLEYAYNFVSLYSKKYNEWIICVPTEGNTIPDKTWIYDLSSGEWTCDNKGFIALGEYSIEPTTTWENLTLTWEELLAIGKTWDSLLGVKKLPNIIFGSDSKYTYIEREYLKTEDDINIEAIAITKDYLLAGLDALCRIQDVYIHYKGTLSSDDKISVYLSVDQGNSYVNPQYFNDNEIEDRLKKRTTWNNSGRTARLKFIGRYFKIYGFEFGYLLQGVSR